MSDEKKTKHGSYEAFEKAAKEWNKKEAAKSHKAPSSFFDWDPRKGVKKAKK